MEHIHIGQAKAGVSIGTALLVASDIFRQVNRTFEVESVTFFFNDRVYVVDENGSSVRDNA